MAELSLRERLQPALFDRLIDEERLRTLFEVTARLDELQRLGISERDFADILGGQGLQPSGAATYGIDGSTLRLSYTASAGQMTVSQLKTLRLKPPSMPRGVELQSFCEVSIRTIRNEATESSEQKNVSMRRLREYVCRDLAALLNCSSLDATVDLTPYPWVQHSVVNFGMPSLAGRIARTVDPQRIAKTIEATIENFEPRLSRVRVTAEMGGEGSETHVLAFRIEAELWGQPVPQQLLLRTSVDVDTGDVRVADSGAR
jgi:type VI secretion system protein ImpF